MGRQLDIKIPIGLGDALLIKAMLDRFKHLYERINISFYTEYILAYRNGEQGNYKFLNDLAQLLFSEPPYNYIPEGHTARHFNPQEIQDHFAINAILDQVLPLSNDL